MNLNGVPESRFKISETQAKAISLLVHLLRSNGDKVLSGTTKLSVTTAILHIMNEGFSYIVDDDLEKSFNVQLPTHFKQTIYQDLMCLYDFVQKTVGLKVTHGITTLQHNVNLINFRTLKVLEIKKIPVHMIVGLKYLRDRLTTIICCRCLNKLQDIFEMCGADRTEPSSWYKLTIAILSYNNIDELDSSLVLLPNLEALDLGHNSIRNTQHLESLGNLKWLNLSYNHLEAIPSLSFEARIHLRSLSLRNNNLEDLNGVQHLHCLEELDVGYNCLVQHTQLKPLHFLKCLKMLWLDGNPLSFHNKHRLTTMSHLQPEVINAKFQLDGQCFTCRELNEAKRIPKHVVPCGSGICGSYCDPNAASNLNIVAKLQRSGSVDSTRSCEISEDFTASTTSTTSLSGSKKKRHKIREIAIEDSPKKSQLEVTTETDGKNLLHLETKQKVEKFRKELGSAWLVASSRLQYSDNPSNFMGGAPLPKIVKPVPVDIRINSQNQEVIGEINNEIAEIPICSSPNDVAPDFPKELEINDTEVVTEEIVLDSVEIANHSEESQPEVKTTGNNIDSVVTSTQQDVTFSWTNSDSETSSLSDNVDDPAFDEDEQPFIVDLHRYNDVATLLVSVQGDNLRERDSLTGRILECLDIKSLLSMEKLSTPPFGLRLTFDYIRKDRRERIYALEDEENCQFFINLLQPILEARTMEDLRSSALQCLACGAQFSKDVAKLKLQKSKTPMHGEPANIALDRDYLREVNACPNCDSHMIIELDHAPLPKTQTLSPKVKFVGNSKLLAAKKSNSISYLLKQKLFQKEQKQKPTDLSITAEEAHHSSKSLPATPTSCHRQKKSLLMECQQNRGQLEHLTRYQLFSAGGAEMSSLLPRQPKCRSLDDSPLSTSPGSNQVPYSNVFPPRDETREESIVSIHDDSPDSSGNMQTYTDSDGDKSYGYSEMCNSLINNNVYKYPRKESGNFQSCCSQDNDGEEYIERRYSTPVIMPGMRRSESDVTILSNPSQSSISILSTPSGDQPLDSILESSSDLQRFKYSDVQESSNPAFYQFHQELAQNKNLLLLNSSVSQNNGNLGSSSSGSLCSSTGTAVEKSVCDGTSFASLGSIKGSRSPRLENAEASTESIFESVGTVLSSDSLTFHSVSDDNDDVNGTKSPLINGERYSKSEPLSNRFVNSDATSKSDEIFDMKNEDQNINDLLGNTKADDVVQSNMMKYSYDNYAQIDHRIRLYVDMTLLGEGETFELILKSTVIAPTKLNEFVGLLIISTKNAYILKIIGEENNEPSKWLQKVDVKPLSQLKAVKVHLGCQGFFLDFGSPSNVSYLFLLCDMDRCNRFMDNIVGLKAVFGSADVMRNPEQSIKSYLQSALNDESNKDLLNCKEENFDEVLLYCLGSLVKYVNGKKILEPATFVLTPFYIHIFTENHQSYVTSLKSGKDSTRRQPFQFKEQQKISDLIAASLTNTAGEVKLCFLNEDSGEELEWYVAMETNRSLSMFITTLQEPWKLLFNIDLPITRC